MYTVKELLEMCRAAIPVSNANAVYHIAQALLTAPDTPLHIEGEAVEAESNAVVIMATAGAIKSARAAGVSLLDVSGSGPEGQVTLNDVHEYTKENKT